MINVINVVGFFLIFLYASELIIL